LQKLVKTIILIATLAALGATEGLALQVTRKPSSPSATATDQQPEVARIAREAQSALGKEDFEGAIRGYEKLVKMVPGSAEFQAKLGTAYYSSGRPREAAQAFARALKLKPSLVEARNYFGASLAESGRCQEAIPLLLKDARQISDPQLKRTAEADGLRCAIALDQEERALDFLRLLKRDFPKDPEVLYLTVHVYSDLSTYASQRLLMSAPTSYQVHELYAESLEMEEKWDEAEAEYRRVLEIDPHLPGIHFRIGRLLLSGPKSATAKERAKQEFEEELKVNPHNAGAEYVLGEIARQARDFPQAIEHFTSASQLDPTMVDAFIGLGKSLVAVGRTADAIAPLEDAVKLKPENPVAHYQLSFAYRRTGRTQEADKEIVAYRKANDDAHRALMDLRSAVTGQQTPAQTAEPPE
jgi:tetratricopeptide (TPR) repeat protein